jgi:hypothetical protein
MEDMAAHAIEETLCISSTYWRSRPKCTSICSRLTRCGRVIARRPVSQAVRACGAEPPRARTLRLWTRAQRRRSKGSCGWPGGKHAHLQATDKCQDVLHARSLRACCVRFPGAAIVSLSAQALSVYLPAYSLDPPARVRVAVQFSLRPSCSRRDCYRYLCSSVPDGVPQAQLFRCRRKDPIPRRLRETPPPRTIRPNLRERRQSALPGTSIGVSAIRYACSFL